MKLELHQHIKIHDVVNVMHTVPYSEQPYDISAPHAKYLILYMSKKKPNMSLIKYSNIEDVGEYTSS